MSLSLNHVQQICNEYIDSPESCGFFPHKSKAMNRWHDVPRSRRLAHLNSLLMPAIERLKDAAIPPPYYETTGDPVKYRLSGRVHHLVSRSIEPANGSGHEVKHLTLMLGEEKIVSAVVFAGCSERYIVAG